MLKRGPGASGRSESVVGHEAEPAAGYAARAAGAGAAWSGRSFFGLFTPHGPFRRPRFGSHCRTNPSDGLGAAPSLSRKTDFLLGLLALH